MSSLQHQNRYRIIRMVRLNTIKCSFFFETDNSIRIIFLMIRKRKSTKNNLTFTQKLCLKSKKTLVIIAVLSFACVGIEHLRFILPVLGIAFILVWLLFEFCQFCLGTFVFWFWTDGFVIRKSDSPRQFYCCILFDMLIITRILIQFWPVIKRML